MLVTSRVSDSRLRRIDYKLVPSPGKIDFQGYQTLGSHVLADFFSDTLESQIFEL